MKRKYLMLSLVFVVFAFGCRLNGHSDNVSITVKNDEKGYNFEANYPERKTKKVVAYIEETLKDDQLFADENSVKDGNISLGDSIKFYLKAEPGYLVIDFKKQQHTETNYQKMEALCQGIKKVIGQ